MPDQIAQPRSTRHDSGRGCGVLLFGGLTLASGALFWSMTLHPLLLFVQGQFWVETPCTIISSELSRRSTGIRPAGLCLDITFDYTFAGQSYRGDKYHFMRFAGGDSTYDWKQDIINRYPPGLQTTCFVNPRDPSQSVIHRGFTRDMLWMLFPLPFLLFFLYLLLGAMGFELFRHRPEDRIITGGQPPPFDAHVDACKLFHHADG